MSGFDYVAMEHGSTPLVSPRVLVGGLLTALMGTAALASSFSSSGDALPAGSFVPNFGVDKVLARKEEQVGPGIPPIWSSFPGVAQFTSALRPTCIFTYGAALKEVHSLDKVSEQPGWLYGARLTSGPLAIITGNKGDVLKGHLQCWKMFDGFSEHLLQADLARGYDASAPERGKVRRSVADIVKQDGTHVKAYWYYQLFQRLSETVSMLHHPTLDSTLYLVGTAHISKSSADQVRDVIREVGPDAVFIELCHSRLPKLMKGSDDLQWAKELAAAAGALGPSKKGGKELLVGFCLNTFYGFFKLLGFVPGLEFQTAVAESKRLNCTLVLGDIPQNQTLKAIVQGLMKDSEGSPLTMKEKKGTVSNPLTVKQLLKPSGGGDGGSFLQALRSPKKFIENKVEKTKSRDLVTNMTQYLNEQAPNLCQGLLHDRDDYMASELERTAKEGHKSIVAVVGLAHMDGIEKNWMGYPAK
eukprot:gb/GEZN01004460.1/.p1 GENE.gb/GEZN01004460.1/~~gb/GEZN01004460.1/.p1  ORF type:complete len:471 (+),score=95.90 gb/GEZN01004460.1/:124-1536(+)